jgi:hypothetical protein
MSFLNEIFDLLNQSWLPNLIGLIGGLLGLWTFVDSYLIKFKPKIYIGTRVIIETVQESRFLRLNSIICSLELCNHRKKYGVLYDFGLRIYRADEINSDKAIYYATETIDKIPINIENDLSKEATSFNPITVLPDSNRSVNLILSEVLHRSKMEMHPTSSYYVEAYYQKEPDGKWYFIDKLYLFNKTDHESPPSNFIQFSVLNNAETRDKIKSTLKPQSTSLYTGATHKYFLFKYRRVIYKLIKYPYYRIKDTLLTVPFYLNVLGNWLFDKLVKIPIIKRYGRQIESGRVTFGNPKLKPVTEKSFEDIFNALTKLTKEINEGAKKEAEITIRKQDGKIFVSRHKLSIQFYMSGDTSIHVQEVNAFQGSRLRYNIVLKNGMWNRNYWYLDNYGFTTIKSFVVRVLDAFVIHSNY